MLFRSFIILLCNKSIIKDDVINNSKDETLDHSNPLRLEISQHALRTD